MSNTKVKRTYTVELQELNDGRFKFGQSETFKASNQFRSRLVRVDSRDLARKVNKSALVIN